MKICLLFVVFSLVASDNPKSVESLGIVFSENRERRKSEIREGVIEALQTELHRTKSEQEEHRRSTRCKMIVAAISSAASLIGGIGTLIYSVNKCEKN